MAGNGKGIVRVIVGDAILAGLCAALGDEVAIVNNNGYISFYVNSKTLNTIHEDIQISARAVLNGIKRVKADMYLAKNAGQS